MRIEEHVHLAPWTTLGVGGPARWLLTAATEDDVAQAAAFAAARRLQLFVLGGGSNLLVHDNGYSGVVLRITIPGIQRIGSLLRAGAGESWDGLVHYAVHSALAGIECLAAIPGTVGGTPIQNVGAYGQEVAATVSSVRCFDTNTRAFVDLARADCGFAYRSSIFNTSAPGRYIVTRVDFALHPGGAPSLAYPDLKQHFAHVTQPSLTDVAEAVRTIRRGKGMVVDPADPDSRSAGSFFKNPILPADLLPHIAAAAAVDAEAVPHWPAGQGRVKLPAAWLLERAGFTRGYTLGNAGISTRHTLALVNRGNATAADICALRDRITTEISKKFNIQLHQEPVALGD